MSAFQARFIWYDLMTTDTKAAEAFYRRVIGWDAKESGMPGQPYTLFSAGSRMAAGLMPIPEPTQAGDARPCWTGYIAVDDVDAHARRVTGAGGAVHREPQDIPGVGRFAVVADPQGAVFILFRPNGEATDMPPADAPGHVGWHELLTDDREAAFAFYSGLFGWTTVQAVDMGPMGVYQTWAAGGPAIGGMFQRSPDMPGPVWRYYFNVPALDAAVEQVGEGGGRLTNGPHQVPGGAWIANCTDPQGAMFALVAPRR